MNHQRANVQQRQRRQFRVRKRLRGTTDRPRLSVFRSHKHMYVQIIDDSTGRTLAAASTVEKDLRSGASYGGNRNAAQQIGKAIADRAKAAGIEQVAFDRGACQYHGRVASLAKAAREAGLKF